MKTYDVIFEKSQGTCDPQTQNVVDAKKKKNPRLGSVFTQGKGENYMIRRPELTDLFFVLLALRELHRNLHVCQDHRAKARILSGIRAPNKSHHDCAGHVWPEQSWFKGFLKISSPKSSATIFLRSSVVVFVGWLGIDWQEIVFS